MVSNNEPILRMKKISKSFPGVRALQDVDFEVHAGEVMVLLGENGAGKSTLIKIMTGAYTKDSGRMHLQGRDVEVRNPKHAPRRRSGQEIRNKWETPMIEYINSGSRTCRLRFRSLALRACLGSPISILGFPAPFRSFPALCSLRPCGQFPFVPLTTNFSISCEDSGPETRPSFGGSTCWVSIHGIRNPHSAIRNGLRAKPALWPLWFCGPRNRVENSVFPPAFRNVPFL